MRMIDADALVEKLKSEKMKDHAQTDALQVYQYAWNEAIDTCILDALDMLKGGSR